MSAPTLATSHTAGLRFVKLDLHLHTPASECFADRSVSAQAIVKEALEKGLDGIAVTDHNSGAWVDEVKQAATGSGLVVFPGCEVSCMGGERGIHIIAIFDPACTRAGIGRSHRRSVREVLIHDLQHWGRRAIT